MPKHTPQDEQLLNRLKASLEQARSQRRRGDRQAFKAKLMTRIAEVPLEKPEPRLVIQPFSRAFKKPFWKRRPLILAVASFLIGMLGAMAAMIMFTKTSPSNSTRVARIQAVKSPILIQGNKLSSPALESFESKKLTLKVYEYAGGNCLWLYPQSEVSGDSGENQWVAEVAFSEIKIPEEVFNRLFKDTPAECWVLLEMPRHLEIWDNQVLNQYLSN